MFETSEASVKSVYNFFIIFPVSPS